MTTNEFIKAVENLGYEAEKDEGCITITYKNKILADVFINELYRMSSYFSKIDCVENVGVLFALIFQYVITPIEDRKDKEKEFYLKHKWIKGCAIMYLYRNELNGYCYLGENKCRPHKQRRFTLKDIEEIKEKFNTDLADFELVEVLSDEN